MTAMLSAVAIAVIALSQAPQQPAAPAATGKISGVVTRGDTNQPLEGAMIRLVRWDGGLGQQFPPKLTESTGRFTFEGLRAGEYTLTFSADTFVSLELGQRRPQEPARRVALGEGQHVDKADITLPRAAAIEGRLVDEFGDPAPGMTVQAARVQFLAGKRRLMPIGGTQDRPTDDLGQFRIFNLPPGEYYLVALSGPFTGLDEAAGFALTYLPGTAVPTEATAVRVDVGQDVTGVSFQMVPAAMATVSGRVIDETGKPTQTSVTLVTTSGGDVRAIIQARAVSDPDGSFVFRNVPAGTYALQAFGRPVGGGNLARAPFGALQINVDGDQRDLAVKLAGTTARGRIILEGVAAPPTPDRVRVFPTPINFATGPRGGGPPDSLVANDWTFETKNMNGIRVINVTIGAAGWMLKKVMRNGTDITDQPIDFRDGDVNDLEITLTSQVGAVSGVVTENDKPAPESAVLVFAEDATKWGAPWRYQVAGRPNAQGSFTVSGLPPADYLVIAVPPVQGQDWMDPETLALYRGLATRVSIGEGGKATVNLRLIRR